MIIAEEYGHMSITTSLRREYRQCEEAQAEPCLTTIASQTEPCLTTIGLQQALQSIQMALVVLSSPFYQFLYSPKKASPSRCKRQFTISSQNFTCNLNYHHFLPLTSNITHLSPRRATRYKSAPPLTYIVGWVHTLRLSRHPLPPNPHWSRNPIPPNPHGQELHYL